MSWQLFSTVLVLVILSLLSFCFSVIFLGLGVVSIQAIKQRQDKEKTLLNPKTISSKPVAGGGNQPAGPYVVPKITSVYHGTCVLPATVGDSTKGTSTKVAAVVDMFWTSNIVTTHQQHGPIDFLFIVSDITRCRGVKFHRNPPPDYAKSEQEIKAAVPKFQDLLQKVSNGHSSVGKVDITAMELSCSTDFVPNDWCYKVFDGWNKQVHDALQAKTPRPTIFAVYTPEVQSCWGGYALIACKSKRNPDMRCHMFLNTLNSKIFVHELGHNLGDGHSIGDPMCIMGPGSEYINAFTMYTNGWLDNAELLELDQVCRDGGRDQIVKLELKPANRHGIVLYLAVALFVGDRFGSEHLADKHSDVVPFPFATIAQRTFSNGDNHVLVHTIDTGMALPPVSYGLAAPQVFKLAHLDQVGSKYKLDTSRAQGVPLAFVYSKGWTTWSPVIPSIFSTLGFNAGVTNARPKLLNLEITLTEKSATGAVVTLAAV
jgi:hypothetical protein